MSRIECTDLRVDYGKRVALQPFTDSVDAGEWLGLIGPNGAGKSSLIRAIAGVIKATGEITVDGVSLSDLSLKDRAKLVAYVPQNPLIPDDMAVFDYVLLGRTPFVGYFGSTTGHDRSVVDDVLERLRLVEFRDRLLGELSGGERQRIVLARALAQQASILLLDEPTSALDIGHQQQALELVTELRCHQQLTVISAMHDLTLAATYTDRLTMLDEGAVVATGPGRDVLTAERLGTVFNVCVTVTIDEEDGAVIVVPRRGFPA